MEGFRMIQRHKSSEDLVLATAASPSHFRSLMQFLLSVERYAPEVRVVAYSMGLGDSEKRRLRSRYPRIALRDFDFASYPAHFALARNNGAYAWKPAIVWEALADEKAPVCWMDSGNTLTGSLDGIRKALARNGFYSPWSPGTLGEWTHRGMLNELGVDPAWCEGKKNLNGACMAFDPRRPEALRLAERWKEGALSASCIAPEGSSRENHRYDQALLTILAYQAGLAESSDHEYLGFKLHQDVETRPLRAFLRTLKRGFEYRRYARGSARKGIV